jgi:hypothetical protein
MHGWPVFFAISGFAIVCRDATVIIAPATSIAAASPVAPVKRGPIVAGFRIAYLLTMRSIDTGNLRVSRRGSRPPRLITAPIPENAGQ